MIKNLFEGLLESVAGKIIVTIVTVVIMFLAFFGDEARKNRKVRLEQERQEVAFKQELEQDNRKFLSEEQRKKRNEDYTDIINNPSVTGIQEFIQQYPTDKRNGQLRELEKEIIRKYNEKTLWNYVRKTENPCLDSLFALKDVTNDMEKVKYINTILIKKSYAEIKERIEYNKIKEFATNYPSQVDKIRTMYKLLERLYYQKFIYLTFGS